MNFPQYRKLEGFQRFYKILDERTFIEVALLNGKASSQEVKAEQYPEMLRIKDMLEQQWSFREMSEEEIDLYFAR
jgi:hypothetical protein